MRPLLTAVLLWAAFSWPALAQPPACAEHKQITDRLATMFSELRIGIGMGGDGNVVELFASEQGSWTILVTFPRGLTCLIAAGESWQSIPRIILNRVPA